MPAVSAPPTWQLVELLHAPTRPCPVCGEAHRYLMRKAFIGDCVPVHFPPGIAAPSTIGLESGRWRRLPAGDRSASYLAGAPGTV